jgi:hypothetical protein
MTTRVVIAPFIHTGNPNVILTVQDRQSDGTWVDAVNGKSELGIGKSGNGELTVYDGRRFIVEEMPRT